MKNHFEHFQAFIEEQKKWFEQHLSADFAQTWNDHIWVSGNQGSGWLRGNGRNTLRFDEMNRFKGIVEHLPIDKEYSQFMKAMLVVVYRQGNRSMSPAVAKATLMILKRWYHAMLYETGQTHPSYLSTVVIQRAMDLLSSVSSPSDPNTANYKGRCVSLQKLVNHFTFTLVKLQYNSDVKYTNKTNLTRKARETMALKQQAKLSDTTTDGEDALITIRGFLNIVALIQRVESDAEKIALNCLLLLVITGFRSIEAFNLRQDALFKRQIDDPAICKRFQDKGLPDYFLGIRYVGVKGAGERTHWVEPLAVPLVESIFSTVKMLTAPIRSHLTYLRAKSAPKKNSSQLVLSATSHEYRNVNIQIRTLIEKYSSELEKVSGAKEIYEELIIAVPSRENEFRKLSLEQEKKQIKINEKINTLIGIFNKTIAIRQ